MEQLIESIYQIVQDYRTEEGRLHVRMTPDRVRGWINQFDDPVRMPVLREVDNILRRRYASRSRVKDFLKQMIVDLARDFSFNNVNDFLRNLSVLSLQPEGKSQRAMISLFDEIIQENYGLSLANCGTVSKKYSIYMDDVLCTGLTLISDLVNWSNAEFAPGITNKQAIIDGSTILVLAYLYIHSINYYKKRAEMRHKISAEISDRHKLYFLTVVQNGSDPTQRMDFMYPMNRNQPQTVLDYKDEIVSLVDDYTRRYDNISPENFFRPEGSPVNEEFFSSAENRKLVENTFLLKGIDVLQSANVNIRNMRALGYSLPSLKNFGFGAICFTWRNAPNNTPLVFWYSGGGFVPLFVKRSGNQPVVFNPVVAPQNPIQDPIDDLPF